VLSEKVMYHFGITLITINNTKNIIFAVSFSYLERKLKYMIPQEAILLK
jgi:hypothetical protein